MISYLWSGTLFRDSIFSTYNATKVASLTTAKQFNKTQLNTLIGIIAYIKPVFFFSYPVLSSHVKTGKESLMTLSLLHKNLISQVRRLPEPFLEQGIW